MRELLQKFKCLAGSSSITSDTGHHLKLEVTLHSANQCDYKHSQCISVPNKLLAGILKTYWHTKSFWDKLIPESTNQPAVAWSVGPGIHFISLYQINSSDIKDLLIH
jgi:hypothetical protein